MNSLMMAGVELMLIGMGTVFTFLTVLVVATTLMSKLTQRLQPQPVLAQGESTNPSAQEMAAIAAAIHQHQNKV
jgi:oxaloacetate decarboxylase gamma subunit